MELLNKYNTPGDVSVSIMKFILNDPNVNNVAELRDGLLYWITAIEELETSQNMKDFEDVIAKYFLIDNEYTRSKYLCLQTCSKVFSHAIWKKLANGYHSNPERAIKVAMGFEVEVGIECCKELLNKIARERNIDLDQLLDSSTG